MTKISASSLVMGPVEGAFDRCAHLRNHHDIVDQNAIVMFSSGEQIMCDETSGVVYCPAIPLLSALKNSDNNEPGFVFIGCYQGKRLFALGIPSDDKSKSDIIKRLAKLLERDAQDEPFAVSFQTFRDVFFVMSDVDMACASTAKSLFVWHQTQRFCGGCGQPAQLEQWGWKISCLNCGTQVFPRTDVAVIMQVQYQDKVLLGRSYGFPEGMYSFLAGFLEPGETIEEAVQRETFEEAGIRVTSAGYTASQPWPFPMTLMIGCWAEALSSELTIDRSELEDARWFSRQEINLMLHGQCEGKKPPREGTIARFMLEKWVQDGETTNK